MSVRLPLAGGPAARPELVPSPAASRVRLATRTVVIVDAADDGAPALAEALARATAKHDVAVRTLRCVPRSSPGFELDQAGGVLRAHPDAVLEGLSIAARGDAERAIVVGALGAAHAAAELVIVVADGRSITQWNKDARAVRGEASLVLHDAREGTVLELARWLAAPLS